VSVGFLATETKKETPFIFTWQEAAYTSRLAIL